MGNLDAPEMFGMPSRKNVSRFADPFTGKVAAVMAKRHEHFTPNHDNRSLLFRKVLLDGPAWEPSTAQRLQMLAAVTARAKPKQKRLGAKKGGQTR